MNLKQIKNNLLSGVNQFESYKKKIELMVAQGKKNGEDIISLCNEITSIIIRICTEYTDLSSDNGFTCDINNIFDRIVKIKTICGGNDDE